MKARRNHFMNPRITDPEYLLTRLRRDDLKTLVEEYLPEGSDAVVLDFGARKALYRPLFSKNTKSQIFKNFCIGCTEIFSAII